MTELEYILKNYSLKSLEDTLQELNVKVTSIDFSDFFSFIKEFEELKKNESVVPIIEYSINQETTLIERLNFNNLIVKGEFLNELKIFGYYSEKHGTCDNIKSIKFLFLPENFDLESLENYIKIKNKYPHSYEVYLNAFNILDPILKAVNDENYDIQVQHDKIKVLIKYDSITITNSQNNEKVINNLYVVISCDLKSLKVLSFEGFRASYSIEDVCKGYAHSHLTTRYSNPFEVSSFCTGATDLSILLTDLKFNFNPDKFELLLYQVNEFVVWESLEGTPYRRMSDTSEYNSSYSILRHYNKPHIDNSEFEDFLLNIAQDGTIIPDVDIEISNFGDIYISINNELELSKKLSKYTIYKGYLKDGQIVSYVVNNEKNLENFQNLLKSTPFYSHIKDVEFVNFRLNPIQYEITIEETNCKEEEFYTDPRLFSFFCNEFTEKLSNEIRKSIFPFYSSNSISEFRYTHENLVPLFEN